MNASTLHSFLQELEKIGMEKDAGLLDAVRRASGWLKNQHNALNVAAGEALQGYQTTNPITGNVSPPVLGTVKNFAVNKLPDKPSTVPRGRLAKTVKRVATSKPVQRAIPVIDQASEMLKLAQVKPYQQKTQYSCSAACLKAVLEHWGADHFAEHEVMRAIGVDQKGGAEVNQITAAAKSLGFDAHDKSFESLEEAKQLTDQGIPIIADIQSFTKPGAGHYVVISEITDDTVTLMDPNTDGNHRVLTRAEMEKRWWDRQMEPPHDVMPKWGVVVTPRH